MVRLQRHLDLVLIGNHHDGGSLTSTLTVGDQGLKLLFPGVAHLTFISERPCEKINRVS
ncbi:hypothetical protein DPMN_188617 [Dreissena polymorpha]|uniref:Uncharacterized protein n=1 Tax=Dreissena polymorpha TaxID=45954 RepID=A0A9D4DQF0_DREPO|nr:hypothetical protein DPMN_188617 [Dreissena polymorpha]